VKKVEKREEMTDLAYVLLTVVLFGLLGLAVRGAEKL
jgi:hypothetical protein